MYPSYRSTCPHRWKSLAPAPESYCERNDIWPWTQSYRRAVRVPFPLDIASANFRVVKRQRRVEAIDALQCSQPTDKEQCLEDWLTECSWSRSRKRKQSGQQLDERPNKRLDMMPHPDPLHSPIDTATTSERSVKSTASVRDTDYRRSLGYCNIYIEEEDPPSELMRRVRNIISRPRQSPEIDHDTVACIRKSIRKNKDKGEEVVKFQIAVSVIPGFNTIPDERLEQSPGQLWHDSVPIPNDPDTCFGPALLPLPKPKPDLAFGYSKHAFSLTELRTIELLVQSPHGKSFASPDGVLLFPFLIFEFKSQAKEGSLYTGTNQAAGAGAIAMNGILELWSRSFGLDSFDFNEPRVFSVTMDQNFVSLNVHWIGTKSDTNQFSYNLEEVSMYILKYGDGIQHLKDAIKNICDHFANEPLKAIKTGLAEYREKLVARRDAESAERTQHGVESRRPRGDKTSRPPSKKVKQKTAASKKGRVARKAEEETYGRRQTRASTQKGQKQAEIQTTGVRTRRGYPTG